MAGEIKKTIDEIETYIREGGGEYRDWFIGVTDNPLDPIDEVTLLHKVQCHRFMYMETISQEAAKAVADYFVSVLRTDGNLSENNGSRVCRAIYIYKKAPSQPVEITMIRASRSAGGAECRFSSAPLAIQK
jgi:hypothetical protein